MSADHEKQKSKRNITSLACVYLHKLLCGCSTWNHICYPLRFIFTNLNYFESGNWANCNWSWARARKSRGSDWTFRFSENGSDMGRSTKTLQKLRLSGLPLAQIYFCRNWKRKRMRKCFWCDFLHSILLSAINFPLHCFVRHGKCLLYLLRECKQRLTVLKLRLLQ